MHLIIKKIIKQRGVDILYTKTLISCMDDEGAFDDIEMRPYKKILRNIVTEEYTRKLVSVGAWNAEARALAQSFAQQNKLQENEIIYVLACLAYGIGWLKRAPKIPAEEKKDKLQEAERKAKLAEELRKKNEEIFKRNTEEAARKKVEDAERRAAEAENYAKVIKSEQRIIEEAIRKRAEEAERRAKEAERRAAEAERKANLVEEAERRVKEAERRAAEAKRKAKLAEEVQKKDDKSFSHANPKPQIQCSASKTRVKKKEECSIRWSCKNISKVICDGVRYSSNDKVVFKPIETCTKRIDFYDLRGDLYHSEYKAIEVLPPPTSGCANVIIGVIAAIFVICITVSIGMAIKSSVSSSSVPAKTESTQSPVNNYVKSFDIHLNQADVDHIDDLEKAYEDIERISHYRLTTDEERQLRNKAESIKRRIETSPVRDLPVNRNKVRQIDELLDKL